MNMQFFELWILRIIEESSHTWIRSILYVLSLCFQWGVKLKTTLYDHGWCKTHHTAIPVVCVDNITAGGTGKTPLIEKLAHDLKEQISLAIVSTGYRSLGVTKHDVIMPRDKKNRLVSSAYCGDEPFLIHQHLPDVPLFLSKNRTRAVGVAHLQGNQLVLLDDGFQRRSIAKDLVVIVLSARDLFGKGYYLPRGFLRESPQRLQAADFLCVTGTGITPMEWESIVSQLRLYSSAPIIGAQLTPRAIKGAMPSDLAALKGKKAGVFCGIGRPKSYLETLAALGVEPVDVLVSPDHCLPHPRKFKQFIDSAASHGAEMVLCTEKDFVKIVDSQYDTLPVCYVESKLMIVYGVEHYEALKSHIVALTKRR